MNRDYFLALNTCINTCFNTFRLNGEITLSQCVNVLKPFLEVHLFGPHRLSRINT